MSLYMEASRLFLRNDTEGTLKINPETMDDAVHPSAKGYLQWGEMVVRNVQKLLHVDPKQ
jgi:lysophospholipase L1-like esterase